MTAPRFFTLSFSLNVIPFFFAVMVQVPHLIALTLPLEVTRAILRFELLYVTEPEPLYTLKIYSLPFLTVTLVRLTYGSVSVLLLDRILTRREPFAVSVGSLRLTP